MDKTSHILVSRTDHLGDVVLALPVMGLLRKHYPLAKLSFLGTQYSKPLLLDCPDINQVWDWTELQTLSDEEIVQQLKAANIGTVIHLYRCERFARLTKLAGIPCRIGRWQLFHKEWWYYNRWLKKSPYAPFHQHEAEWNVQMLKPLGIPTKIRAPQLAEYIHLVPSTPLPESIASLLKKDRFTLILHPGSHGNGCEWPSDYYMQLIKEISEKFKDKFQFFITGGPQERERFLMLLEMPEVVDVVGKMTLPEFITFMSCVDGLVVSGTGPLHMSAALGTRTLGLFPPRRGPGLKRWAPVGKRALGIVCDHDKLCHHCPGSRNCLCMRKLQVAQVMNVIQRWYNEKSG